MAIDTHSDIETESRDETRMSPDNRTILWSILAVVLIVAAIGVADALYPPGVGTTNTFNDAGTVVPGSNALDTPR